MEDGQCLGETLSVPADSLRGERYLRDQDDGGVRAVAGRQDQAAGEREVAAAEPDG